jgi:hypothetical protein
MTPKEKYEVIAHNSLRHYSCYYYQAESKEDAIEQFLKEKNKKRGFFSSIKAIKTK